MDSAGIKILFLCFAISVNMAIRGENVPAYQLPDSLKVEDKTLIRNDSIKNSVEDNYSDSLLLNQKLLAVDTINIEIDTIDHASVFSEYTELKLHAHKYNELPYSLSKPKRPWVALGEDVGLDILFHLLTRYVANEDYAHISWSSIKNNFETGFIWDNDNFKTNLFSHPYQGNLYYNAARTNGLNFWESAPYAFLGSLIWEMFMETQPPSTNDIIATTFGGIGIGETAYRVSSLILCEQSTGFERVVREICAGIVNPVRGVNRLIYGDAWKITNKRYVDKEGTVPFHLEASLGMKLLKDRSHDREDLTNVAMANFSLLYGNPFEIDGKTPFQFIVARLGFNLFSDQPNLCKAKFSASIWGLNHEYKSGNELFFGIFQNYNFYNSESLCSDDEHVPFRIGETVSYGPALLVQLPFANKKGFVSFSNYLSGIVLGGALSDHYLFQNRDYNMGSGYSVRSEGSFIYDKFTFLAAFENYHIFTWNGYENKDYENIDPNYLDVQGATGDSRLSIMKLKASFQVYKHFGLSVESTWYWRSSYYKYFDDVTARAFETSLTATYVL